MNKQAKYSEIRNFSLIIAGLPGAVLVPFFIAGLVSYLSPFTTEITNAIATPFMFITMAGLPTSAIAMFGLLIAALITASKKPTDPESPTPKAKRNQIVLAVIAAAIATPCALPSFSILCTFFPKNGASMAKSVGWYFVIRPLTVLKMSCSLL